MAKTNLVFRSKSMETELDDTFARRAQPYQKQPNLKSALDPVMVRESMLAATLRLKKEAEIDPQVADIRFGSKEFASHVLESMPKGEIARLNEQEQAIVANELSNMCGDYARFVNNGCSHQSREGTALEQAESMTREETPHNQERLGSGMRPIRNNFEMEGR